MRLPNYGATSSQMQAPASGLVLFKQQILFDPKDLWALTKDFFSWFENEWRQPVVRLPDSDSNKLLDELSSVPSVVAEETYCFKDLASMWNFGMGKVKKDISVGKVQAIGVTLRLGRGGKGRNIYRGRDLTQVVCEWEWERLCQYLDARWEHFLPEPCGMCVGCHENPNTAIFYCQRNIHHAVKRYRTSLFRFLGTLRNYADIESWWRHERDGAFARKPRGINSRTGIILLYLLDRHLLDLTLDDILCLPLPDMEYDDLLRPWQHRRPEEYEAFLRGLEAAKYGKWMQKHTLALMSVMVLLKYGFPGVTELGRRLAPEEVQQALNEGRLLTMYLGHGAFLGFPLSDDICVGHVVLDDIRLYFWDFMATKMPTLDERRRERRGCGPRKWQLCHIMAVERALGANVWQSGQALLSPRPETEKMLYNPYFARLRAEQGEPALRLLPQRIQESVQAYINYRYQAQRITLGSLKGDVKRIMPFLSWAFTHTDLSHYDRWDRNTVRGILSAYLAAKCSNIDITSKYKIISSLHVFFETLAELNLPHPPGYQAITSLLPPYPRTTHSIPPEDVLDRIFREGVCFLDYDPFARLALTIQYYCGTRVTETCDLPLFCIWEEPGGEHAFLVIPRGKTNEERTFPIVSVGMGPLLEYMDQVVSLQLFPDGKPRNSPRMNIRYLDDDAEKAYHWHYLFDRVTQSAEQHSPRRRVLNRQRVSHALEEAMLLAASKDPSGILQEETYSPRCRRRRDRGQKCHYIALRDGVSECPVCGGFLPGYRGYRCCRTLTESYTCDGLAHGGAYFCPKCDAPLADLVRITTHTFRHNSVTRAYRHGVSLAQNMLLHGHKTVPMHIRYLHLLPEDQQAAVYSIFSEKFLSDIRLNSTYAPGQVIEEGMPRTPTLEQLLGLTLRRGLKRRTAGLWGGFWAGVLAEEGVLSPVKMQAEMIITEETYHHTVAQYRYEALGLAVSEVALENGTKGKFKATVAPFLERREIERVVSSYLEHVRQGYLNTARGAKLFEADILAQRAYLSELAEMLRPWWQPLGSIERLVCVLFPAIDSFQKQGGPGVDEQE